MFELRPLLRLYILYLALIGISLALGVAFILIAHGLLFGTLCLGAVWQPTRPLLARLLNVPLSSGRLRLTRGRAWILAGMAALSVLALFLGMSILITRGFLGQNLLFIMFPGM